MADKPAYYPTATIVLPNPGDSWIAPETIEFQGYGTDPEDGVVSSTRLLRSA